MPITVAEKWDSREGTQGEGASTDLRYIIRGTDDDTDGRSGFVMRKGVTWLRLRDVSMAPNAVHDLRCWMSCLPF